jgi:hypothetical protein
MAHVTRPRKAHGPSFVKAFTDDMHLCSSAYPPWYHQAYSRYLPLPRFLLPHGRASIHVWVRAHRHRSDCRRSGGTHFTRRHRHLVIRPHTALGGHFSLICSFLSLVHWWHHHQHNRGPGRSGSYTIPPELTVSMCVTVSTWSLESEIGRGWDGFFVIEGPDVEWDVGRGC